MTTRLIRPLLAALAGLLIIYEGCRLFFFLSHRNLFSASPSPDIIIAFWHGLRFDLATLLYINTPYLLLRLIPLTRRPGLPHRLLNLWFAVSNAFFIFVCMGDTEYFHFTGKRLTMGSLGIIRDMREQAGQITLYYWYYPVLALFIFAALWRWQIHLTRPVKPWRQRRPRIVSVLKVTLFVALWGLGARGGLQTKPLHIAHAMEYATDPNLAQLTLNSAFTLLRSGKQNHLRSVSFFPRWDDMVERVLREQKFSDHAPLAGQKPNIVLIIMESFNFEYMGHHDGTTNYTPFLNELAAKSVFYPLHFANGRRSIDALPSILAGLPNLMEDPLITSPYQSNQVVGLPSILAQNGYDTWFFHGGQNGTMFFDVMAKMLGVQHYVGLNEYPHSGHFDGKWGIFDEPFFQHVANKLDEIPGPFMASVFSLSSHHPYAIPPELKGRFPKGKLEIHESIGYADYALRRFFDTAATKPWFNNTLFIITADHTSKSETPLFESNIGRYRVPLLFYHPSQTDLGLAPPTSLVEQADIMPTVLNLLGLKTTDPMARFGHSLVTKETTPLKVPIVFHEGGQYWLVADDTAMRYTDADHQVFFDWRTGGVEQPTSVGAGRQKELREFLESRVQYFNTGMLENRINLPLKPPSR